VLRALRQKLMSQIFLATLLANTSKRLKHRLFNTIRTKSKFATVDANVSLNAIVLSETGKPVVNIQQISIGRAAYLYGSPLRASVSTEVYS